MFDSTENNLESLENYQKRVRILQDLESMDQTSSGSDGDHKQVGGGFVRFS